MENRFLQQYVSCKTFFILLFVFFVNSVCVYSQTSKLTKVAENDCGVKEKQPFLILGNDYTLPVDIEGSREGKTCNFGGKVIYAFDDMDIQARYEMEVVYLVDSRRTQQVSADGNVIHGPVTLEKGKEQRYLIPLPEKSYAYGQLVLVFEEIGGGPNVIVSELNIYSSNPKRLKPFEGDNKEALAKTKSYKVDENVDVEKHLPVYAPIPKKIEGVYESSISLDGMWNFNPKADGDSWYPIVVPGQWSMQGFSVDSAGYAAYQRDFTVPRDWNGKRVRLRFDGVSSESEIYINSEKVGGHMGGMTAFEMDITNALQKGTNSLLVKVRSESLADMLGSLTQYAAHQIGGITRKVTLFAVPDVYISDLRVETDFDDEYKDAELKSYITVVNTTSQEQRELNLCITLDGTTVVINTEIPALSPGKSWSGWVKGTVDAPKHWTNETPNLYSMTLELINKNIVTEQVKKRIGFREIVVDGTQVKLNGKAIKLAGVCRHVVHPLTGRVLSSEFQRRDVELYREANCNFIRTSHYPPGEELLEICDELGMFVEVEAPVCWVGHHANENWKRLNYRDPSYYDYILHANLETIHFYRNHPSVIFWSIANESYWNKEFAQVHEYVKKADTTRPVAFHDQAYGGFNNQGSNTSIANIHYPGPNGHLQAEKSDRPMVFGEYCHLNVYNRSELVTDPGVRSDWALALQQAWENMYKTKEVLGGSIWSGIDDIFQLPNGDAVGYGPWGPIDGWRRPKPEYWDMKKIYSPVRILTEKLEPSNHLSLSIENRYTYTNMEDVKIEWTYGDEAGIVHTDIQPKKKAEVRIPIQNPSASNELYLRFTDPRGFVADEYRIPVGSQVQNQLGDVEPQDTRLKTNKNNYVISGKGFSCTIDRTSGQIISMSKNNKVIINGGPWLMALPLSGEGCYPDHNADVPIFNNLCSNWQLVSLEARKAGQNIEIEAKGRYKEFEGGYTLKINANGEFKVDYIFNSLIDVNPRQWGIVFESPKDFDRTFWRRDGIWTVYPEDHISRPSGEARLFYPGLPSAINPRIEPAWSWSMDFNELGSADFRSTRRNIFLAGLKDADNSQVIVKSDGLQSWRSWLEKDKIRFLIADFVSPGYEMFLGSYYAPYRKPVKAGDTISGSVTIRIK